MPLKRGKSRAVISENIREMQAAGHPHDQSVAAAMREAYGSKRMARKAHDHHDGGMAGGHGMSPRKAMASGKEHGGGNFGVQPYHEQHGTPLGRHPDHVAHTGRKEHLEDHERATGPGIHHTKHHHPSQAAPDHGPHHVDGYGHHDREDTNHLHHGHERHGGY